MRDRGIAFDYDYTEGVLAISNGCDADALGRLAELPAIDHILRHLRLFGVGEAPDRRDLVVQLVSPLDQLNLAHPRLLARPYELVYYLVHELHHAAYLHYQAQPPIRDASSREDVLCAVRLLVHLESLGVFCPWDARRAAGAIASDPDYVALENEKLMVNSSGASGSYTRRRTVCPSRCTWTGPSRYSNSLVYRTNSSTWWVHGWPGALKSVWEEPS